MQNESMFDVRRTPQGGPCQRLFSGSLRRGLRRAALECLEHRAMPTIVVTTASDAVDHSGVSLRDAIAAANANAAAGVSETITFAPDLSGATITLAQGQLHLSGVGSGLIAIDGGSLASPITISGNHASTVLRVESGVHAVVNNLTITAGNAAGGEANGGGIDNRGFLTLMSDTLDSNRASGDGAGIYNTGTLTVWASTTSANAAQGRGGGLFNAGGSVTASNSTFFGNSAAEGGGLFNDGSTTISSSSFVNNTSTNTFDGVGGVYAGTGTLFLINSYVTSSTPRDVDRAPDPGSHDYLIGDSVGAAPLADNGGPTKTVRLGLGSPALGAAGPTTTLAADVDVAATTITVALGAAIAQTPGDYPIQIDHEELLVTNVSGNMLTVVRGYGGTMAATHSANAVVELAVDQRGYAVGGTHDLGAVQSQTTTALYVQSLYLDILRRNADGGRAYWETILYDGGARSTVTYGISHSVEYYKNVVIPLTYQDVLQRKPDEAGQAYWLDQMLHHGLTDEGLTARLAGSSEFYTSRGGGTDPGWLDAIYETLLGRSADAQGKAFWLGKMEEGESRYDVAYTFAESVERQRALIADAYMHYLGREPDQAGLNYWLGRFAQGETDEDIIAALTASDEYYNSHSRSA